MVDASVIATAILAAGNVDYGKLVVGCTILLLAMVSGFVGVFILRRRLRDCTPQASAESFSLQDLRQLHREGQLSDEEFERAKAQMVAHLGPGGRSEGNEGPSRQ